MPQRAPLVTRVEVSVTDTVHTRPRHYILHATHRSLAELKQQIRQLTPVIQRDFNTDVDPAFVRIGAHSLGARTNLLEGAEAYEAFYRWASFNDAPLYATLWLETPPQMLLGILDALRRSVPR